MSSFFERLSPVWQPHDGQREFLLHPAKFKVLACGRRWGKTDACAAQIVAALHEESPTRHLIIAPTLDQARLLFDRVVSLLEAGIDGALPSVRTTPYPRLRYSGHVVTARSGHIGKSLRGNEATHIVVDEAAYLPEEIVTEVAMPMLATNDGYLTLISTPHGMNHFWRFFEMGQRGEHGIWSRRAPSMESPFVHPSFLEVQRDLISERAFAIEYEASFRDGEGRVFKTDAVERCLVTHFEEDARGPFFIGVDWARYHDYTAVVVLSGERRNARLVEAHRFSSLAWNAQAQRVAEVIARFPGARVHLDATGVGDPLLENVRALVGSAWLNGLTFTNSLKNELINGLAWMIDNAALKMEPHPQLLRELQHFEAKPSASGGWKLSAVSGYHDDLVIALALAAHGLPAMGSEGAKVFVGGRR